MRIAIVTVLTPAILVASGAAATLDPSSLVLRSDDVPRGFVQSDAGVRTNSDLAKRDARAWKLIARMGRVTGYGAGWSRERSRDFLVSNADVFGRPAGARAMLDLYARELERSGTKGLRRSSVSLGDQGWVWHGGAASEAAFIAWRHGRVVAVVVGWSLRRDELLRLARKQERRIAAALG